MVCKSLCPKKKTKKTTPKKRKKKIPLYTLQVWGFDFSPSISLEFFFSFPYLISPLEKFLHDSCHTWKSKKKKKKGIFLLLPSAFIALGFCSLHL